MPNFAVNATARFIQRYTDGINNHSHMWRAQAVTDPADMAADLADFYNAVAPLMFAGARLLDASYYAENSDTSVPATAVSASFAGSGTATKVAAPNSVSFIARSTGGSNFKIRLFGVKLSADDVPGGNYRFESGENATIDAAIAALTGMPFLRGIDLQPLVWKSYANYRVDSYWQTHTR